MTQPIRELHVRCGCPTAVSAVRKWANAHSVCPSETRRLFINFETRARATSVNLWCARDGCNSRDLHRRVCDGLVHVTKTMRVRSTRTARSEHRIKRRRIRQDERTVEIRLRGKSLSKKKKDSFGRREFSRS